jgi:WD40 repeat protein
MPLHMDVTKVFAQRSERVKCVDFHPSEPWLLTGLYNGTVCVWNYNDNTMVKSFTPCEHPGRSFKGVYLDSMHPDPNGPRPHLTSLPSHLQSARSSSWPENSG